MLVLVSLMLNLILQAGKLDNIPVFEVSVDKAVILYDQEKISLKKKNKNIY